MLQAHAHLDRENGAELGVEAKVWGRRLGMPSMRRAGRCATVTSMARPSITIVLELDETTDVPSGSARLPDGTTREFHGWIGLAEAIGVLGRPPERSNGVERQPTRKENPS